MKVSRWLTPPAAVLVAVALVSCSSKQKQSTAKPPQPAAATAAAGTEKPKTLQQTSQDLAAQQTQVETAHQAVLATEQQLAQQRAREDQERAKLIAIQQSASRTLEEAQLRTRQEAAASAQAQGLQTVTGEVVEASSSRVILHAEDGRTMTFAVSPRTRVLVGVEQRSVKDLQQGADAQVAYDGKTDRATAVTIHVLPATR
jgi:hypothetical protein